MRIAAALAAADKWRMMVALHVNLGRQPIADMWLQAGRVAGYDFLPLSSIAAIAEEADAMRNCLHTYGYNLAHNRSRLWSVRRHGEARCHIEGRYLVTVIRYPASSSSRVPETRKAPRELWWAARQWLHIA